MKLGVVSVTTATREEAQTIAEVLIREQWAACVQIIPGLESHYFWEGKYERSTEYLLTIKTSYELLEALERRVRSLHSYTCPEFVFVTTEGGAPDYLEWWESQLKPLPTS